MLYFYNMGGKFFSAFPAFKYKSYRLYFFGQLISLIGSWLQLVAQGWLVLVLTHSPFLVGLVSAIGSFPSLIFSLAGGVIVDRFSRKKILYFTQIAPMILAFILGILTIFNIINVLEIAILSFLLGSVNSIDMPARQAFVVEMVEKKDLTSAIALNSGIFNGARIIGPAVAGIVIAILGIGGAFILNALSYIAVIAALYYISVKKEPPSVHPRPLESIKEGLVYSFSNPTIKILLIFVAVISLFGWSYSTMMPVIVKDIYHRGAESLGYFYSASGAGALLGIILVSAFSKKIHPLFYILFGNFLFAASIFLFSFVSSEILAFPLLFLAGLGLICSLTTINSTIQHLVKDSIRGRVMSIYTLMFLGMFPVGSLMVGYLSDKFSLQKAISFGAAISFLFGIYVFFRRKNIIAGR